MTEIWDKEVNDERILGILECMGSYATAYTFKKILDKVDAKKRVGLSKSNNR